MAASVAGFGYFQMRDYSNGKLFIPARHFKPREVSKMPIQAAPLPSSFMAMSIIGYVVSVLLVFPLSPTWGFAFTLVFIMMFIASVISMTYADDKASLEMDVEKMRKVKK
jgi:hypothetical protein